MARWDGHAKKIEPPRIMCCEVQRVGRATGKPCPNKASACVQGRWVCGTHARLIPEYKKDNPAVGIAQGHQRKVNIGFDVGMFELVRQMASDRQASFAGMTRKLVGYAIDELALESGQNALASDNEADVPDGRDVGDHE
jgi:hypothetical protein